MERGRDVRDLGQGSPAGFASSPSGSSLAKVFSRLLPSLCPDVPREWQKPVGPLRRVDGDGIREASCPLLEAEDGGAACVTGAEGREAWTNSAPNAS